MVSNQAHNLKLGVRLPHPQPIQGHLTMSQKVVIVERLTDTDITIGGTVFFASQGEALDWVKNHNATNANSRAYCVQVSENYSIKDNVSQGNNNDKGPRL